MSNIAKKILIHEGRTYSATVWYSKGGTNLLTGNDNRRGYHVSVTPVTLEKRAGYVTETIVLFHGMKRLVVPCARQSPKRAEEAQALFETIAGELLLTVAATDAKHAGLADPELIAQA